MQAPFWQVSVVVHKFPSLHDVPSAALGLLQRPVAPSQVPATWQASNAEHANAVPPVHKPLWQVSEVVHKLPSLQLAPLALVGLLQTPVAGAQTPASWHWSDALHVTGLAPVQVPAWQASDCVHKLLSSHAAPSVFIGCEQTPLAGLHVPTAWHWSCAAHTTGVPAWQLPPEQTSCVQALPSRSHALVLDI